MFTHPGLFRRHAAWTACLLIAFLAPAPEALAAAGLPAVDPQDEHRFVMDGAPWYPAGYYPGLGALTIRPPGESLATLPRERFSTIRSSRVKHSRKGDRDEEMDHRGAALDSLRPVVGARDRRSDHQPSPRIQSRLQRPGAARHARLVPGLRLRCGGGQLLLHALHQYLPENRQPARRLARWGMPLLRHRQASRGSDRRTGRGLSGRQLVRLLPIGEPRVHQVPYRFALL